MTLLTACLVVFALGALLLAVVTAVSGPRKADRLGGTILPVRLRTGSTGGLLNALEGVENRWVRVTLLCFAAIAFAAGAAVTALAF
ncbi:MAG: hypothetical protein KF842_11500 [Caulobacter sp.]|nr:hypothetical protein [Caulobacter sp.]